MPDDSAELISLLKGLRLFSGLDDRQLAIIASVTQLVKLPEGHELPLPKKQAFPLYIIQEGEVQQEIRLTNGKTEPRLLKKDDFFGADVLLVGGQRKYSIKTLHKTTLLKIDSRHFSRLLATLPILKSNVRQQLVIYRRLRRKTFSWITQRESVYRIMRQHPAFLVVSMLKPVVLGWLALLVLIFSTLIEAAFYRQVVGWVTLGIAAAAAVWALWIFLDWLNDYFVITDQRVVWLARVILIYESRQEAPLSAVKSEEVKTSLLGRLLGYGDVITYAFLGQVTFRGVAEPYTVREIIAGLRQRTASSQVDADKEERAAILRNKFNPPTEPPAATPAPAPARGRVKKAKRPRQTVSFGTRLRQYFQTYVEEGGVITYRKHIFILLKKVWVPGTLMLIIILASVYAYLQLASGVWTSPSRATLVLVALALLFPLSLWWLYQYVDWRNDIYQITDDKIIDSERKPLGTEITKSAPLENILSLDYERIGLLGVLLNMGNVIINTGTDKLTWMTITNPARAQREIFYRMMELRRRKRLADAREEWDQQAEWFLTYEEYKQAQARSGNPQQS